MDITSAMDYDIDDIINTWMTGGDSEEGFLQDSDGYFHPRERLSEDPTNILYMLYPDDDEEEYSTEEQAYFTAVLDSSVLGARFAHDSLAEYDPDDSGTPGASSNRNEDHTTVIALTPSVTPLKDMEDNGATKAQTQAQLEGVTRPSSTEYTPESQGTTLVQRPSASRTKSSSGKAPSPRKNRLAPYYNKHTTSVCKVPSRLSQSFTLPPSSPLRDLNIQ